MKTVTSTQTTQGAPRSELVDTLFEVGTDWARQGIGIGIAAVRTQAGLFRTLSTTLDRAADAIAASAKPITDAPDATPAAKAAADDVIDTTATVEKQPRRPRARV